MPHFPEKADRVHRVPASVFERFREKMKEKGSDLVRLHIGDTYLHPRYSLPISDTFMQKTPYFNRYCNTFGVERFRRVLRNKLQEDNGFSLAEDNILTTNGATNALSASVLSLMNPGEEILVLTPCWPFFPGMVKMADARVVEVPFYTELYQDPDLAIEAYLQKYLTSRTVALYLNTPNNPSGKVLNRKQLQQLADFVKKNKLWIISDEAYDGLVFDQLRMDDERKILRVEVSRTLTNAEELLGKIVSKTDTITQQEVTKVEKVLAQTWRTMFIIWLVTSLVYAILAYEIIMAARQQIKAIEDSNIELEAMADELKKSEERLRRLSSDLFTVQENERRRISMELHDELGQAMAALKRPLMVSWRSLNSANRSKTRSRDPDASPARTILT